MFEKVVAVVAGGLCVALVGAIGFVGWLVATHEPDVEVARRRDSFTLVGINPPKHFYVDLRDAKGTVRKGLYVSKHCNEWHRLAIGQTLYLAVVTYRRPASQGGATYEEIKTAGEAVCPRA